VDANGTIENINEAAQDIFGIPKRQMVGKTLENLFIANDGGEISLAKFKKIFMGTKNSFDLVRKGKIQILGIRANGTQFYPNITIRDFAHSTNVTKYMLLVQDITENVISEQRFVRMFDQQSATLKALPDLLITVDTNMSILEVVNSTNYAEFIHPDHNGSNLAQVLSQSNFQLFADHCAVLLQSNADIETWNFHTLNDNGSSTYYEARATRCGPNLLIILRDETDVVVTREELLESEEHFRVFGQASSEAMMIHNDTQIMDWNPRLSELTGFSSAEISQMRPEDFYHPLERAKLLGSDGTNKSYSSLFYTKDGKSVEVSINERQVEWKNERASIRVIRDITHLKDVEQLLNVSRERYQSITDNTFDVVCCYDPDLNLSFVNQTFMDYFNRPAVKNISLLDVIDQRDHHRIKSHLDAITPINPVRRTMHRVNFNGVTRWLDWIDRAIYDADGKFLEYQGIGRDVTDYIKNYKTSE
jgi:PAS domain S-box-containing protein